MKTAYKLTRQVKSADRIEEHQMDQYFTSVKKAKSYLELLAYCYKTEVLYEPIEGTDMIYVNLSFDSGNDSLTRFTWINKITIE